MDQPPKASLAFFALAMGMFLWGITATRTPDGSRPSGPLAETASTAKDGETIAVVAPDYAWSFNALDPGMSKTMTAAAMFNPSDDYWGLPRQGAYDLVAGYCGACHSLRIVMQQRASESRWRELMTWMVEKQGMAPPPDQHREEMVAYLAAEFGD